MKIKPIEILEYLAQPTQTFDKTKKLDVKGEYYLNHPGSLASLVKKNLNAINTSMNEKQKTTLANRIRQGKTQDKHQGFFNKLGQWLQGHKFQTKNEYLEDVAKLLDSKAPATSSEKVRELIEKTNKLFNGQLGQGPILEPSKNPLIDLSNKINKLYFNDLDAFINETFLKKAENALPNEKLNLFTHLEHFQQTRILKLIRDSENKDALFEEIFQTKPNDTISIVSTIELVSHMRFVHGFNIPDWLVEAEKQYWQEEAAKQ